MGEHDDEELQRAFRMSLQPVPDAKRSKPRDNASLSCAPPATPCSPSESADARTRRLQREVLAAAAEQRRAKSTAWCPLPGVMDASASSSSHSEGVSDSRSPSIVAAEVQDRVSAPPPQKSSVRELGEKSVRGKRRVDDDRQYLPYRLAEQLYTMVLGTNFSKDVLAQWCNQGFRFSSDFDTSLGLVQREGGPCGILAPIQALVLKYLLFVSEDEADVQLSNNKDALMASCSKKSSHAASSDEVDSTLVFLDPQRTRALVRAMGEALWRAGAQTKAVLVVLDIPGLGVEDVSKEDEQDEVELAVARIHSGLHQSYTDIGVSHEEQPMAVHFLWLQIAAKALDGVALDSVKEFHRLVRVVTLSSISTLHVQLQYLLPAFRSRMGALLLLFSVLLSRGLDAIQSDRDDPDQPLVTPPFGHASQAYMYMDLSMEPGRLARLAFYQARATQRVATFDSCMEELVSPKGTHPCVQEIVNLFLCGQAVPNVFDGSMDLGGGMCLKGIPTSVEVGFLTLLESLNLCKVGQHLKRPRWPIWVVGSESHYTVLFALTTTVQDESDIEDREIHIHQAFDAQDQSGGGGFIGSETLHQVLSDLNIEMPQDMFNNLCSSDIVVWNDFWQALCQLDTNQGGLKDSSANLGKRLFDLLHFNGIAKRVATMGNGGVLQRPRLSRLQVTVPPKWTPDTVLIEEYKAAIQDNTSMAEGVVCKAEPPQHAPLVDCIRTRWQQASCNWTCDTPSIV